MALVAATFWAHRWHDLAASVCLESLDSCERRPHDFRHGGSTVFPGCHVGMVANAASIHPWPFDYQRTGRERGLSRKDVGCTDCANGADSPCRHYHPLIVISGNVFWPKQGSAISLFPTDRVHY